MPLEPSDVEIVNASNTDRFLGVTVQTVEETSAQRFLNEASCTPGRPEKKAFDCQGF